VTATAPLGRPSADDQTPLPATGLSRRRWWLPRVLLPAIALLLLIGAVIGVSVWRASQRYVSTDNAQISGEPIQVGSMNAGRVDRVNVKIGDRVSRGALLARVALPSAVGVAQNGQPKLDFLGAADTRIDVTSPIDGLVLATPVGEGADVPAGQPIVTLVDPSKLWVNANIDETSIDRVRVGQPVTVHVDALSSEVPGVVEAITPATASTFSMLPSASSSGTFNKVVQQVPVRINLTLGNQPALLGTSVEVKIHVAE
jgi:multidrug resistance efflux pump